MLGMIVCGLAWIGFTTVFFLVWVFATGGEKIQLEWVRGPLVHVIWAEELWVMAMRDYGEPLLFLKYKRLHDDPHFQWKSVDSNSYL